MGCPTILGGILISLSWLRIESISHQMSETVTVQRVWPAEVTQKEKKRLNKSLHTMIDWFVNKPNVFFRVFKYWKHVIKLSTYYIPSTSPRNRFSDVKQVTHFATAPCLRQACRKLLLNFDDNLKTGNKFKELTLWDSRRNWTHICLRGVHSTTNSDDTDERAAMSSNNFADVLGYGLRGGRRVG
jgi:hypothetical protein